MIVVSMPQRDVLTRGMGGTTTLVYMWDDSLCIRELEASSKNSPLANNDISLAAQVALQQDARTQPMPMPSNYWASSR